MSFKEVTFEDFPIIHHLTNDAYASCTSCGAEYFGIDAGRIPYNRTTASGDYGTCLFCEEEMSIDLTSGGYY